MATEVSHVSDTARWVAVYRAQESARPDALFHDVHAARLAGDRGNEIATMNRFTRQASWPLVVRTKLMDDLVLKSIAEGCDRVVNLAAGLDTRPYRLALPNSLSWLEVDLPAMIDEKEKLLANEKPNCELRREKCDLADSAARTEILSRALADAKNALVITEGLIIYLEPNVVEALGRDIASHGARWWMFDVVGPGIVRMMQRRLRGQFTGSAVMRFAPENGIDFARPLGWTPREVHSLFREAAKYKRLPPLLNFFSKLPLPDPKPTNPGRAPWSAVVRCERATS